MKYDKTFWKNKAFEYAAERNSLEKENAELKDTIKIIYKQALYDSEKILNIIEDSSIGLVMRSVRGNIVNDPYFESDHKAVEGGEG